MNMGKVSNDGRIRCSFDAPYMFTNPFSRLLFAKNVTELNSENEGRKIFSVQYRPSSDSQDLQERAGQEVDLSWQIELVDNKTFDIVLAFSNAERVS